MILAAPLALIALLLVPLVILLHAIAARWRSREVSSLAFWEDALHGLRTSLRVRRLLKTLALLAAVLAVVSLVIGLARPLVERAAPESAGDTVLVLDVTAGMAARSGASTRFDRAKQEALALVAGLGRGSRMCVVAAGRAPRVLQPFTDDREALRRAVAGSAATDEAGVPEGSLLFALGLREPGRTSRVVFVTDGAFASLGDADPELSGVRVIAVGERAENAGITALGFRRDAGGGVELFASVAGSAGMPRVLPLVVSAGGREVVRRDVALGAGGVASVSLPWEGPTAGRVSARIGVDDALAADDAAYAVFAPARALRVLLVGQGDAFLEAALARFPGVTLRTVAAVDPVTGSTALEGYDLAVFDGVDVPPLERGSVLAFAAVPPGLPIEPAGMVESPRFTSWDRGHPLFASLVPGPISIERALRVTTGPGVRVAARSRDAPLVATWEREDLRVLFVAFRPSWSDLPLRAAFPLFVANALAWFRPGVLGADAASHRPGETVEVGMPDGAREARVTGPDGRERTWPVAAGVLAYAGTSRVGFHRVETTEGPRDIAVSLCDPDETDLSARYAPAAGTTGPEAGMAGAMGGVPAEQTARREPAWFAFALAGFFLVLAEGLFWSLARRGGAS